MKRQFSLYIDSDIIALCKQMYPKETSKLVEDFLRGLTQSHIDIDEKATEEEYNEQIEKISEEVTRGKLQLRALQEAKKIRERAESEDLKEYLEKAGRLRKAMPLSEMMRLTDEKE